MGKGMKISAGIIIMLMITIPLMENVSATTINFTSPYSNVTTGVNAFAYGDYSSTSAEDPTFSTSTGVLNSYLGLYSTTYSDSCGAISLIAIKGNTFTPTTTTATVSFNWQLNIHGVILDENEDSYIKVQINGWIFDNTDNALEGSKYSISWTTYSDDDGDLVSWTLNGTRTVSHTYTGLSTSHTYRLTTEVYVYIYLAESDSNDYAWVDMMQGGSYCTTLNYERVVY